MLLSYSKSSSYLLPRAPPVFLFNLKVLELLLLRTTFESPSSPSRLLLKSPLSLSFEPLLSLLRLSSYSTSSN
jgi:hypothetical protein